METLAVPVERRVLNERRSLRDRRTTGAVRRTQTPAGVRQVPTRLRLLGMILVGVIGLAAYKATGLYDAVESNLAHMFVGGGVVYYFLLMFRSGLHRK